MNCRSKLLSSTHMTSTPHLVDLSILKDDLWDGYGSNMFQQKTPVEIIDDVRRGIEYAMSLPVVPIDPASKR